MSFPISLRRFYLILLALAALVSTAKAGHIVTFDRSEYTVAPGEVFRVQVDFDWDDLTAGLQPCPEGLGSLGLKLTFNAADARLLDPLSDVFIPSAFPVAEPSVMQDPTAPIRNAGPGWVEVRGSTEFSGPAYDGTLLATFDLENLAAAETSYDLNLGFYFTSSISNFTPYNGGSIDNDIAFGSATVTVVPEPGTFLITILAFCLVCGWKLSRSGRH